MVVHGSNFPQLLLYFLFLIRPACQFSHSLGLSKSQLLTLSILLFFFLICSYLLKFKFKAFNAFLATSWLEYFTYMFSLCLIPQLVTLSASLCPIHFDTEGFRRGLQLPHDLLLPQELLRKVQNFPNGWTFVSVVFAFTW